MNDTNRRYHDAHAPHAPAFLSRSEQRRLDLQPGAIETIDAIKRERDEGRSTIARLTAENARYREALHQIEVSTSTFAGDSFPAEARDAANAIARRALADADTGEGRGEG